MAHNILERIFEGREKPTNVPFSLLENITGIFSEDRIIGEGGFGTVYKGVLRNGNVAVKRIKSNQTIDDKLFRREVNSLMKVINHQNVVRFLGFCSSAEHAMMLVPGHNEHVYAEIRERLLCFEYINNGSLDKHITDELRGLEWDTRYQIIKGICEGLRYLHVTKKIIHMDLKPANILLDSHMVPKITDFGLSRLTENSKTTSAGLFGSLGYCAPEFLQYGRMSVSSDIYSLGVIIIELVTGRKSITDNKNTLRRWRHMWNKSAQETSLASQQQQVTKCIELGLLCQNKDPCDRPSISDVLREIGEMESMNKHATNANESTAGQINHSYLEDDMLGVEPLELHFTLEDNKQIARSVELTNHTDGYIAFNIHTLSLLPFSIQPNKDIVPPRSKCSVDITLLAQDKAPQVKQYTECIVRSVKVNDGLTTKDINKDIFNIDMGNVDDVNLVVVFDAQLQQAPPCLTQEPKEASPLVLPAVSGTPEVSDVPQSSSHMGPGGTISEVIPEYCELLDIHPLELRFPFKPNKLIPCSLHITNKTDECVVFRVKRKDGAYYLQSLPLHGIVPPRSTYTLVVTTQGMKELPEKDIDLILQCSVADEHLMPFRSDDGCDEFFDQVKEMGNTFNEVTLKAVCAPQGEIMSEIISVQKNTDQITPLIQIRRSHGEVIIGLHNGQIRIWNYDTQRLMRSCTVSNKTVFSAKFVARKQWFLTGSADHFICVYDYGNKLQKIKTFRGSDFCGVTSLAVHPTQPYMLSADCGDIKLWDWDKDWECIQTFNEHSSYVSQFAFNPRDNNIFASASEDHTVKVWHLDSPKSSYTLSGHSDQVSCLDFFTRDGQQYLVTGSKDHTAKIWDTEEKTCIYTIEGFTSGVTSVISLSNRPCLITGSEDGVIHFWSSSDYRLERILRIGYVGEVCGLACLMGSKGIVIGQKSAISIMDIDSEEPVGNKGNNEKSA